MLKQECFRSVGVINELTDESDDSGLWRQIHINSGDSPNNAVCCFRRQAVKVELLHVTDLSDF